MNYTAQWIKTWWYWLLSLFKSDKVGATSLEETNKYFFIPKDGVWQESLPKKETRIKNRKKRK